MAALSALLEENGQERAWRRYMADCACLLVRGRKYEVPRLEFERKKNTPPPVAQSGSEILDGIITQALGEVKT